MDEGKSNLTRRVTMVVPYHDPVRISTNEESERISSIILEKWRKEFRKKRRHVARSETRGGKFRRKF